MSNTAKQFDKTVFSHNLKKLMKDYKIKNKELAAELGLSKSAISNYIAGRSVPRTEVLAKIAEYFGVSIEQLINDNLTLHEEEISPYFPERLNVRNIYKTDNFIGNFTLPFPIDSEKKCYAFQTDDACMVSSGILNGSIVIFIANKKVKNNELAAVLLKDKKKIVARRISMVDDKIILTSDKSSEVFKYKGNANEVVVLGKVVLATFFPQ